MDQSGTIRRSITTIAKRSRPHRRRAPFILTIGLAVLSWVLIAWAWCAVSAWLA